MVRSNAAGRGPKSSGARSAGRGESVEGSKQVVFGGHRGRKWSQKGLCPAAVRPVRVRLIGVRLAQKWGQCPYLKASFI